MDLNLNFIAPINDLGYGIHARGIISGLSSLGHESYRLKVIGQRSGELSAKEIVTINGLSRTPWNRKAPCLKLWHEYDMEDLSGSRLIAYPVWETTKLLPQATNYLSQMDAVIVTSKWGEEVLKQNIGDQVPVFIVNEAGQEFYHEVTDQKFPTFTFLHVGKFEYRKCTAEIIESYVRVFRDSTKETRLIMHCFNPFDRDFTNNMYKVLEGLGLKSHYSATDNSRIIGSLGNAIVEIPKSRLSKAELYTLYKRSHVGIYPSRGEGWNLDLFESITAGMPCVASYVSAHTEYLKEDLGYPQDLLLKNGKEEVANDGKWFKGDRGNWISPDKEELTEKIRYSFNNYESLVKNFDMTKIKEKFTWENSAKQLISVLNEVS